jgi:hypothetical protein
VRALEVAPRHHIRLGRAVGDIRRRLQAHRPDLAMRLLGYWKR